MSTKYTITINVPRNWCFRFRPYVNAIVSLLKTHPAVGNPVLTFMKLRFSFESKQYLDSNANYIESVMTCTKIELIDVNASGKIRGDYDSVINFCQQNLNAEKSGYDVQAPELIGYTYTTIADIPDVYILINDEREVKEVLKSIGKRRRGIDSLFVKADNGEYKSVYGFAGVVPTLEKSVKRLR